MKFKISPPFYATWWFLSLLALLTGSTIYIFYRLRVNRLLAVEKLRNKVARDLHDDMGSTLSTINILSSMAKSKLTSDTVTSSSYISKITDNSQRMMEAMDDIVWSIKPDNDTMQRVVARMREYATNLLEAKEIKFDFFVENDILELKLDMEARRDLFLIFKEAINNTAKYSKCCNVAISLTKDDNCLKLKIADNGIGFKVNQIDKGNGIDNMKKRAVALKGRIELKSELNKGTSIILIVPVSKQKFHIFM